MTQFSYTIQDELGLHARPAGLLAKEAAKFKSTVTVEKRRKKGRCKEDHVPDDAGRKERAYTFLYCRRRG